MTVRGLDHVNINTTKLAETRAFYVAVLGLIEGYRPDFPVDGSWLYCGDRAIVHLVETTEPVRASDDNALHHFAFAVTDFEGLVARLDQAGIAYQTLTVPGSKVKQAFLKDPNGAIVELNCQPI
jgi:catechol 2,3-dioxygenase-like lactoylglutathione lyase family enzyme